MVMRVATLVFLVSIQLCFPHSKSVAKVIQNIYEQNTEKKLRTLKKFDYQLRKDQTDLEFLVRCNNSSVTPQFV